MDFQLRSIEDFPDWFPLNKIEELESIAAIGYTPEKIAMYFDVDPELFKQEYHRPGSRIRYHCDRGVLVNEADEAKATQEAANVGNATQAQRLDKRRYQIMFDQLKDRIIYGKE